MSTVKKDWAAGLSLALAIAVLCGILAASFFAVKTTAERYKELTNADLSQGVNGEIYYNDHIYAQIGFGKEISADESDKETVFSDFLSSSVQAIDGTILAGDILYAMMISVILQYYLYKKFHADIRKYVIGIATATIACYAAYLAGILLKHLIFGLPFIIPAGHNLLLILLGLLAVICGNIFLGAVISAVRLKKITALAAIPVVFVLFLFSLNFESQLYSDPTLESFAYIASIDSRARDENFEGEYYYDADKNVVILDGHEYEPEIIENTNHFNGAARAGAFAFEFVNPYSGNELFWAEQLIKENTRAAGIPYRFLAAYAVKALILGIVSLIWMKRRKKRVLSE